MSKSHREVDDNGFLLIKDTPVSSFGVFDYAAWQVGIEDGDPNRIVKVYRPESEIMAPEAIASFQVVPFIDEHDLLSGFEDDEDVMSPEEKGVDGVMFNVRYVRPWLRSDVKAFTRRMQRAINSGKVELSLGYGCDFVLKSGVHDGQPYEVVQVNMRGNHLALVEAARVEGAKVLDSKVAFDCLSFHKQTPNGDTKMAKRVKTGIPVRRRATVGDSSAVEKLKALIPALEQYLTEESGEPAHQEEGDLTQTTEDPDKVDPTVAESGDEFEEGGDPDSIEGGDPDGEEVEDDEDPIDGLIAQVEQILAELKSGETAVAQDEEGVEGLLEGGEHEVQSSAEDCDTNGKASKGPSSGKNVGDAAVRRSIYADIDKKNKLYERVSPLIGAFDHALMTAEDVASYAAKKLRIAAPKGQAALALDSYLSGVERSKVAKTATTSVGDSAFGSFDPIDNYLKGA